jgi:hypothetical protein
MDTRYLPADTQASYVIESWIVFFGTNPDMLIKKETSDGRKKHRRIVI